MARHAPQVGVADVIVGRLFGMVLVRTHRQRALALAAVIMTMAGCQSGSSTHGGVERIKSDPKESFSSKVFGVAASPRVTDSRIVRKGGGRVQIGKPYKVRGKWYYPKDQPGYVRTGKASWYGASFHGRLTANGEVYDMFGLSAAHPTLPLPSYARVTNTKTGSTVMVRVNDRGPYHDGRVMDLSSRAAELLGYKQDGVGDIKVEYVGRAPTEGDDTQMLMASYRPGAGNGINDGMASGVMVASNETPMSTPSYASAMVEATTTPLPGVRPLGGSGAAPARAYANGSIVDLDAMSVGGIIAASAGGSNHVAKGEVSLPRRSKGASRMIVSSYAPAERQGRAAGAIEAMVGQALRERIELGVIEDPSIAQAVRRIAADRGGRLIADGGRGDKAGGAPSYAFQARSGEDVDAVLKAFWRAGADQAFVLRE